MPEKARSAPAHPEHPTGPGMWSMYRYSRRGSPLTRTPALIRGDSNGPAGLSVGLAAEHRDQVWS